MESVLFTYQEKFRKEDEKLFMEVRKLKEGNRETFENVYKLSEKYIYSVIYRIIQDNDRTADLMQETYLQIYNKIDTLENEERFLVWAGRIATNITLRYIQKSRREILPSEEEEDFIFEKASDDKEKFIPEDIILNKEKKTKIQEIIDQLSAEQKITVQYYYLEDMSVNEIADIMQCSPGTVKSRLNYARKKIKQSVIDTEQKEGIKLYSLSGLPVFWLLFREEASACAVPKTVSSAIMKGIAESLGIGFAKSTEKAVVVKKGFKSFIRQFIKSTGGKVAGGVAAATISVAVVVTQIPKTLFVTSSSIDILSDDVYAEQCLENSNTPYLVKDKYLILCKDGKEGLFTVDGKEILPVQYDDILYNETTGGMFLAEKDFRQAYYDESGKMVPDRMYDEVSGVSDGIFWCYDQDSEEYKVFADNGKQVSVTSFAGIYDMINGLVVVGNDDYKKGVLRKDGKMLLDTKYDEIYLGDGEYIAAYEDDTDSLIKKVTVFDNQGNIISAKEYEGLKVLLSGFYNGVAMLGGWYDYAVGTDQNIIFDIVGTDYSNDTLGFNSELYPNGYFSHYNYKKDNGEITLFNSRAEKIANAAYMGIDYANGKFIIEDNGSGKKRLIDDKGNEIIKEYDSLTSHYDGKYYIASDEEGCDLYDANGLLLYDDAAEIESIGSEMFRCERDNGTTIVNGQSGECFSLAQEEDIVSYYSDGYAIKYTDYSDKYRDLSENGETEEPYFKIEIIDKKGKVKYKLDLSGKDFYDYDNFIILKKGIYSYEYNGKCYIKTW